MLVTKNALSKAIRTIDDFDSVGSPFVGLQWGIDGPLFHRSGPAGYIESIGYRQAAPDLIVSIPHFKTILARFEEEQVDLSADRNGVLTLRSVNASYDTELRVHTIRQNITWAKAHDPGPKTVRLDETGFSAINTGPFDLASPPVLRRRKLLLATAHGIIVRSEVPVEAYPYPREAFLRAISPLSVETLHLTQNGYWAASAGGFQILLSGHRLGEAMFDSFDRSATTLAELPGARLAYALTQAAAIAAKKARVTFDPAVGLRVPDAFGNDGTFSLGVTSGWPRFMVPATTAQTLADALKQSADEVALLQQVDQETFRIKRGLWEVSFKFFDVDSSRGAAAL